MVANDCTHKYETYFSDTNAMPEAEVKATPDFTEKQFKKIVGRLDKKEDQEWLKENPVEMTSEWVYKWEVYNAHKHVIGTRYISDTCPNACFSDYESEGLYGHARYLEDHDETEHV